MSAINSLATYIGVDLGIGAVGTTVFRHSMPDAPDTCVAIYDTGGGPPTLTTGDDTDTPSFQILSRSLTSDTALANLLTIFQALHGLTETTLHGTHFKLIWGLQSNPIGLGLDQKQRFVYAQNFRAMVTGVTR